LTRFEDFLKAIPLTLKESSTPFLGYGALRKHQTFLLGQDTREIPNTVVGYRALRRHQTLSHERSHSGKRNTVARIRGALGNPTPLQGHW
jgi:hypothetical protein